MSTNYHKQALTIYLTKSLPAVEMLHWLAMNHPAVFVKAHAAAQPKPDARHDPEVLACLRENRLIDAIKRWRQITGDTLKDSKDAVEALRDSLRTAA